MNHRMKKYRREKTRFLRRERLEPRHLLATVSWDGGAGTELWDDAANWSNDALPTSSDDVMISAAADVTVVHNRNVTQIRSLTTNSPFQLSGGELSISEDATIHSEFTLSGGVLTGDADVELRGASVWSGGEMDGGGKTTVAADGQLTILSGVSKRCRNTK